MKKQILFGVIVLLTVCSPFYAQNSICDKVFNFYAEKEGVTMVNISGSLCSEIFSEGKTNEDCKITSIKILTVDDSTLNSNINFYKLIVPNLNKKDYEQLMIVKSAGQDFVILIKKEKEKISEAILVSGGQDNALIYITGSLSMSNLQRVTKGVSNSGKI